MKKQSKQQLIRTVEAWGDQFTPACACGCGEPVPHNVNRLNTYVNRQHQAWGKDYSRIMTEENARRRQDNIPIEDFRAAVKKLKLRKGLTYAKMAEAGGQQPGWLSTYMYDKRMKSIGRETATTFLRKLSGYPDPPTRWERRQQAERLKIQDRAWRETDPDTLPRTRLH